MQWYINGIVHECNSFTCICICFGSWNGTIFFSCLAYLLTIAGPGLVKCHQWISRDYMVVGFTTTCVISAYYHLICEFKFCLWWGIFETTLCDKICQWLATGRWFSPGTPVSSTNKTDRDPITEILLKVTLHIITLTLDIIVIDQFCKVIVPANRDIWYYNWFNA
jgi:hypothetical protein